MNKSLLLTILVAAVSVGLQAEDWGIRTLKEPIEIDLPNDIGFTDAQTAYMVYDDGLVKRSIDRLETSVVLREADGSGIDWERVEFADADVGYAIANDGYIFKTSDAGVSWDMVGDTSLSKHDLVDLCVLDNMHVFVIGKDSTFLKTTDGGSSWWMSEYGFGEEDLDGAVDFYDANFGAIVSDDKDGHSWTTDDGGETWTYSNIRAILPAGTISGKLQGVAVGPDSTVVIVGYHDLVARSTDAGRSFELARDVNYDYVQLSALERQGNTLLASGMNGLTLLSGDLGASWTEIDVPSGNHLNSLEMLSETEFYLFMASGYWFHSADGGENLELLTQWPSSDFNAIVFSGERFFVGAWGGGEISFSNSGVHWSFPSNELSKFAGNIEVMSFLDSDKGLFAGSDGHLSMTADGGDSWQFASNPMSEVSNKTIYTALYHSADTIYAAGSKGYFISSYDGGATWSEWPNEIGGNVYDMVVLANGRLLLAGASGALYTNDAESDSIYLLHEYGANIRSIDALGEHIVAAGDGGNIYHTTLAEWDTLYVVFTDSTGASGDDFNSIKINEELPSAVWAVGDDGVMAYSEDHGQTWQEVEERATDVQLNAMTLGEYGIDYYISGDDGAIFSIMNVIPIDAVVDRNTADNFKLIGNYPNPFNPLTHISFSLEESKEVTMTVYNAAGQKVATLLRDHLMAAGQYDIPWNAASADGNSLPSGIYFYTLSIDGRSLSDKMSLLK